MKVYGVRVKNPNGTWKQVRTWRNRRGRWTEANAKRVLAKLRKQHWVGHVFEEDLTRYPNDTHYSKNFTRRELECKCGCHPDPKVQRNLTDLAAGLELVRLELGHPIGVLSGHRCVKRNDDVGGARNSRHIYGEAADLAVPSGQQDEYVDAALKVGIFRDGGIGVYPNGGVHVDHRPWVARWDSWSR